MNRLPSWRSVEQRLVWACATLTVVLAATVMLGWMLHVRLLVQALPGTAPMQFNTALGFVLGGVALLLHLTGRRVAAGVLACACALWGALSLAQYVTNSDFGLGRLFIEPFIAPQTEQPGRMSANSAATFVVLGLAILALAIGTPRRRAYLAAALLGSVTLAFGLNALFGYAAQVEAAYGWTRHTQMAPHTALAAVLAGAAVTLRAYGLAVADQEGSPNWVALPLLLMGLLLSVGQWQVLRDRNQDQVARIVGAEAFSVARLVHDATQLRRRTLVRMAERIADDPEMVRERWARDAAKLLRDQLGTVMIQVLNVDGSPRWSAIPGSIEHVEVLELVLGPLRRRAMTQLIEARVDSLIEGLTLPDGSSAFAVFVPIYRERVLRGAVSAVVRYHEMFAPMATTMGLRGFRVEIREDGRTLFAARGTADADFAARWASTAFVGLRDVNWTAVVWPTPARLSTLGTSVDTVALALGVVLSVALALAAQATRRFGVRAREIAATNALLEREVTERRRMEERFRLVFDAAPNAMVIADASWNIRLLNDRGVQWFGYERPELLGKSIHLLLPTREHEKLDALRDRFQLASHSGSFSMAQEFSVLRKDASEFPAEVMLSPMESSAGLEVIAAIRDMTVFKEAEEARLRMNQRFQAVVEAMPNAVIIVDERGTIRLVNSQALNWFGYERSELLGQPVEILIPQRSAAAHPALREHYLAAPATRPMGTGRDLFGRRKDGSEFPVDISLSPVDAGRGLRVIASVTDMTDHMEVQAELQRSNESLAVVVRELETFAYSVSHDLRAPLRSMTGFSQILLSDHSERLDDEGRDYLQRIRSAAERMGQLIDDLLGLSRVTRAELRREPVSLSELAAEVLGELHRDVPGRAVDVRIEPNLRVECDAHLLRILMTNLLSNAWKFTGKASDPRIEVGRGVDANGGAYYVRDNGAGFDMAYAGSLFGAFQRLHGAEEFPGTGIGLATAQRIVQRHGGRIWAESAVGSGATFYFTI